MEYQQQPHSYVERKGNSLVASATGSHESTGTRFKETQSGIVDINYTGSSAGPVWTIPIFNSLIIDQGNAASQRVGNSIYIHRVEVAYSLRENSKNTVGPEEIGQLPPVSTQPVITDPRMRIMIVTPKSMYRVAPVSNPLQFPYYAIAGDSNHPEPLQPPIDNLLSKDWGMLGLPDPKRYDVEYDDLRNLQSNSKVGMDSGCFSFLVRRRFDYDQDRYASEGKIYFQDNMLQNLLPQIWFFLPNQTWQYVNGVPSYLTVFPGLNFSWSVRIVYDNEK